MQLGRGHNVSTAFGGHCPLNISESKKRPELGAI